MLLLQKFFASSINNQQNYYLKIQLRINDFLLIRLTVRQANYLTTKSNHCKKQRLNATNMRK